MLLACLSLGLFFALKVLGDVELVFWGAHWAFDTLSHLSRGAKTFLTNVWTVGAARPETKIPARFPGAIWWSGHREMHNYGCNQNP